MDFKTKSFSEILIDSITSMFPIFKALKLRMVFISLG